MSQVAIKKNNITLMEMPRRRGRPKKEIDNEINSDVLPSPFSQVSEKIPRQKTRNVSRNISIPKENILKIKPSEMHNSVNLDDKTIIKKNSNETLQAHSLRKVLHIFSVIMVVLGCLTIAYVILVPQPVKVQIENSAYYKQLEYEKVFVPSESITNKEREDYLSSLK